MASSAGPSTAPQPPAPQSGDFSTTKKALQADEEDGNDHSQDGKKDYKEADETTRTSKLPLPDLKQLLAALPGKVLMDPDAFGKEEGSAGAPEFAPNAGEEDAVEVDLAQGRAQHFEEAELQQKRPKAIQKHWDSMFLRVKKWWNLAGKDISDADKKAMKDIEEKIYKQCQSMAVKDWQENKEAREKDVAKELENLERNGSQETEKDKLKRATVNVYAPGVKRLVMQHHFPWKTILGQIVALTTTMAEIEDLEKNIPALGDDQAWDQHHKDLQKANKKLVKGVAVFTEKLKAWNIKTTQVVSETAYQEFVRLASDAKVSHLWTQALKELEKPVKGHQVAWNSAMTHLQTALGALSGPYSEEAADEVKTALQEMASRDRDIVKINRKASKIGLPETLQTLPMSIMKNLLDDWEEQNTEEVTKGLNNLVKQLRYQQAPPDLIRKIRSSSKGKRTTKSSSQSSRPAASSTATSNIQPTVSPRPEDATNVVTTTTTTDQRYRNVRPPTVELTLEELQAMDVSFDKYIEPTTYKDGKTEYGLHVATRVCQTDNPRYSRFIINAGTADFEYFIAIKGLDLGPGGAEALEEREHLKTAFDVRKRRQMLKKNPACLRVKAIVIMYRSEDYVPKSAKKPRVPDTYIGLEWLLDDGTIKEEWPSRTEFYKVVNRKYAIKKYIKPLELRYEAQTTFIAACKKHMIHPGTKKPLTEQDRKDSPWLFPESASALKSEERGRRSRTAPADSEAESDDDSDSSDAADSTSDDSNDDTSDMEMD